MYRTARNLVIDHQRHGDVRSGVEQAPVPDAAEDADDHAGSRNFGVESYSDANRCDICQARYFEPGDDHGAGGVGPVRLHIDGATGKVLGERLPCKGTVADLFVQAQLPLHSGRILISLMGIVVATLSVTGVYIWWKKRRTRSRAASRDTAWPTGAWRCCPRGRHARRRRARRARRAAAACSGDGRWIRSRHHDPEKRSSSEGIPLLEAMPVHAYMDLYVI